MDYKLYRKYNRIGVDVEAAIKEDKAKKEAIKEQEDKCNKCMYYSKKLSRCIGTCK